MKMLTTLFTVPPVLVTLLHLFQAVEASPIGNDLSHLRGQKQQSSDIGTVDCRVTLVHTSYFSEDQSTIQEQQTSCIPIINWKETDDLFPINLPENFITTHHEAIKTGSLLVSITNSSLQTNGVAITEGSHFDILEDTVPNYFRRLQKPSLTWKPEMTFAIVRISTLDSSPTDSLQTLSDTHFGGDEINFAKQFEACSFGKLKWSLAPRGLIDVKVNKPISSFGGQYNNLIIAAEQTMRDTMNIPAVNALADKVIMCFPPGTGNWVASAGLNHWRINLNNDWCRSLSAIMHEIGHTVGLYDAQEDYELYNDRTGYMGSAYVDATTPRKCFNGYNSFRLGWYSSRHLALPTQTMKKGEARLINLATFVDFPKTTSSEPVIINIADTYYLQYNMAKEFNVGTEQAPNMVTITQPIIYGTDRVAQLGPSNIFQVANFMGLGTLIIQACYVRTSAANKADVMVVSIGIDKSLCF